MASKRPTSGQLNRRVTFAKRTGIDDGYGNEVPGPWVDQYTCAARLQPRFGGDVEGVFASRLAAKQPYNLIIRNCAAARAIRTDWRVVDARTSVDANGTSPRTFNIASIVDPLEDDAFIEMLVIEGEPS